METTKLPITQTTKLAITETNKLPLSETNKLHPLERLPDHFKDRDGFEISLDERPVAPDQFIDGYETTKWEVWAFWLYYVGDSGLGLFTFAPTALQNLLSQAAGDTGLLHFAGRLRSINSIVLLSNGISFSVQVVVYLVLGSFADFGTWRRWIVIVTTAVAIAIGFGWLGIYTPDKWEYGIGLYIVGLMTYGLAASYFLAAAPGLARNTPTMREHAERYNAGEISREEYDTVDSLKRNEIINMGLFYDGVGQIPLIAIGIGILYGLHANASTANNNWALSVLIAWTSAYWIITAIPWFVLEKRRPGQPLPPGKNYLTAGLWQIYRAATQIWKLKQSLAYLIGYFFLGDAFNTCFIVVSTLQNEIQEYNIIQICWLSMLSFAAEAAGIYGFWSVQRRWRLSTKTMVCAVAVCIVAANVYGMVGIWTEAIGFHHRWEFWLWNIWYGGMMAPWYSYSQVMISEVTPRGKMYLFYSLFNIAGYASSFFGPIISSAIIDAAPSHNNSTPFYFLTALSVASFAVILFFVDLKKSRIEQEEFLNDERRARLELTRNLREGVI